MSTRWVGVEGGGVKKMREAVGGGGGGALQRAFKRTPPPCQPQPTHPPAHLRNRFLGKKRKPLKGPRIGCRA